MADFESLPVGTEALLRSLGWELSPTRRVWRPIDRLGRVSRAKMSEVSPEKKFGEVD